ncbi:helix-turn-helix domain-containing protein [Streptomyces indicus]|uniref:Helix-turn-helix domain-containing protein n=1 Tax=Streptomyces indicus TaxID=417292 RepID=A0A1G8XRD3_9ACTN|nr:peptidoglycan-binding protein [Streptomyces indicus]SDJ93108.1 Helix-turn-helix domain-containing protein [Streptomyces indicus]
MSRWKPLPASLPGRERQLAVQLRRLKDRSGLSFAALAAKTSYSSSSWERYLNGRKPVPRAAVEELAQVCGTDPTRLIVLHETARATATADLRDASAPLRMGGVAPREASAARSAGPHSVVRTRTPPTAGEAVTAAEAATTAAAASPDEPPSYGATVVPDGGIRPGEILPPGEVLPPDGAGSSDAARASGAAVPLAAFPPRAGDIPSYGATVVPDGGIRPGEILPPDGADPFDAALRSGAAVPPAAFPPPADGIPSYGAARARSGPARGRRLRTTALFAAVAAVAFAAGLVVGAFGLPRLGAEDPAPVADPAYRVGRTYSCETVRHDGRLHAGHSATREALLDLNSSGWDVVEAQCLLARHGYPAGAADGLYGEDTRRAVRSFQQDRGLVADGIVGPDTWGELRA